MKRVSLHIKNTDEDVESRYDGKRERGDRKRQKDQPEVVLLPKSTPTVLAERIALIANRSQMKAQKKKQRHETKQPAEVDIVSELFKIFEVYEYVTKKQVIEWLKVSDKVATAALKELCVLNVAGAHKFEYSLKKDQKIQPKKIDVEKDNNVDDYANVEFE